MQFLSPIASNIFEIHNRFMWFKYALFPKSLPAIITFSCIFNLAVTSPAQPEAIRKLLTGTVDVTSFDKRKNPSIDSRQSISKSVLGNVTYGGLQSEDISLFRSVSQRNEPNIDIERSVNSKSIQKKDETVSKKDIACLEDDTGYKPNKTRPRSNYVPGKTLGPRFHRQQQASSPQGNIESTRKSSPKINFVKEYDSPKQDDFKTCLVSSLDRNEKEILSDFVFDAPAFVNFKFDHQQIMNAISEMTT